MLLFWTTNMAAVTSRATSKCHARGSHGTKTSPWMANDLVGETCYKSTSHKFLEVIEASWKV